MTEQELKDRLRPAIRKALAKHGIGPGSDGGDPEVNEFSPADLLRFHDYFEAGKDGLPGNMHEVFGVTPKRFSEATGLRQRASGGRTVWVK